MSWLDQMDVARKYMSPTMEITQIQSKNNFKTVYNKQGLGNILVINFGYMHLLGYKFKLRFLA